jgi:hypothetical protein
MRKSFGKGSSLAISDPIGFDRGMKAKFTAILYQLSGGSLNYRLRGWNGFGNYEIGGTGGNFFWKSGLLATETTEDSPAETLVSALCADSVAMGAIARKRTTQLVDPLSVVKTYDTVYESLR